MCGVQYIWGLALGHIQLNHTATEPALARQVNITSPSQTEQNLTIAKESSKEALRL